MGSEAKHGKVWSRFEGQGANGIVKLRIQDLPKIRMEDFMNFILTYFIQEEAIHKATGIAKSDEAIYEYREVLTRMYELRPPIISICCLDTDSEDFDEILAVSAVQIISSKITLNDYLKELGFQPKCKELESMLSVLMVLEQEGPESFKKYEFFYEGRGIIVRPGYRGLGIATEIVKQRRSMLHEHKVPMTCAWMTSVGSQKAAEKDGWETVAEVQTEELENLTGLVFGKDPPTYKLMMATEN